MQEWIRIRKNLLLNYQLLLRQQRDHGNWKTRITNAWANDELSKEERHIFDQFYILPPTMIKEAALDKTVKPSGSIRTIASGEYDVWYHTGFGNFCVNNGVLYSTVGTDIYSLNLSTLAITNHANINAGKEYFKITWDEYPPNIGTEFSWHNVINTMKIHQIYPLDDGSFLLYTGPKYRTNRDGPSVWGPGYVKIMNSDFSETLYSFSITGTRPTAIVPIGEYIYFFSVDSQRTRTITGRVITKLSQTYTITDFSGQTQNTGRLLPQMYHYSGAKSILLYENIGGRLSTTGVQKVWFDTVEEYEQWIENPPDGFYKAYSELETAPQGSEGNYYIYANFYSFETFVGSKAPEVSKESQYVPGSFLATRGNNLVSFDPKSHLIRIMDTTGSVLRSISMDWCDHFEDKESNFRLDADYTQISVDPYHPEYIYILFNGYWGTQPYRLVGRLNIGTD